MCGIAGMFVPLAATVPDVTLTAMADIMIHRGPDGDGRWIRKDRRYQTIFRRLAIIDLKTGDQPLVGTNGNIILSGNGEIYNYHEIRSRFSKYRYKTQGDMESVLAAHEALGDNYPDALNGMYALALYDDNAHTLELIRDRLGVKPIYWAKLSGGGIVYGSEIKAIFASGLINPEINEHAVPAYLAHGYVPGPDTLFKNIQKLQPGHRLCIDSAGKIDIKAYWRPQPSEQALSPDDAAEQLLTLLGDSVRLQLRSDVTIGTLLSGGLDSGLLVALAAQQSPQALKTFTVRFVGGTDESPLAADVAKRYGTDHSVIDVDASDAIDNLWAMTWHLEEPVNDAALLPNYLIERALGEHVTVALNGTGGDELFAGYGRYFQIPVEQAYLNIPDWVRRGIEKAIGPISPIRAWQLARASLFDTNRGEYIHAHSTHFPPPIRDLIGNTSPSLPAAQGIATRAFLNAFPSADLQTAGLAGDIETYLNEDLLTLLDRTSMAHSVEGRVPFLDHRLVEASLSISASTRTPRQHAKALERKMAQGLLPDSVLNAPKQGFVSPVPQWMRNDFGSIAERILTSKDTLQRGWWTAEGVQRLLQDPARHGYRVYTLLALELSVRMFTDASVPTSVPTASLRDIADAA
ncbi:asparagine synthase (glutamine-hydrolyzing) [Rhodospirillales bacterium]|nr:asparagine synthase (glutamine-hydrolyzing) [Rhodospirillales bacterium]